MTPKIWKKEYFIFLSWKSLFVQFFEMHFELNAVRWKIINFILLISPYHISKDCKAKNIFYLCIKMKILILDFHSNYLQSLLAFYHIQK